MTLDIVTLRDSASGAEAKLLPGLGMNVYSFRPVFNGQPTEVFWSHPDFASGTIKPTSSGNPILFPYAGRIRGGLFRFQGKEYAVPVADGRGNGIHGFVVSRPWRVVEQTGDRIVGRWQASREAPELLEHWPTDFGIQATYRVSGSALLGEYFVENHSEKPLPFGFGTHPYFRVPFEAGGNASECRITVPAALNWELDNLLTTGRVLPAAGEVNLRNGRAIGETKLDNVLGQLTRRDGWVHTSVEDPAAKRRVEIRFDEAFSTCVVFNPPHREAVCIEPYTAVPDPFSLAEHDIESHLTVLAPGQSWRAKIEIEVQAM
ncbi:MAG TPA: aldose 1-epimerase [Pirellulales bacterium]